ncbi:restriction modification system DNA specificity domain protein [Bacillus cereus AH820]|uniref:Restriction modification system DNA specificity domain protein n=1 Tax=Bacillus cereus (strain AH820) TaxID=405535 RepID=B7JRE7_BACC0|nr:restriction endonuclease subunit S [Bacillus cereus]ACK90214.1 restriction modification system DNA specificity domain protein [Bacillus cereus AH820]
MSKKKKTLQELLEDALIPTEEHPYEVPGNWIWGNLNSLSKLIVDGSHNPPPKKNEGFPMLSGRNILDGEINFETDRYVSEDDYQKEYKRTPIESNDVLLTIVGTIGRTTVVPKEFSPFVLQRSVALIKPMVNSNYLSYYFSSPYFQYYLQKNAKGTAQKGVYLKTLKSSRIPLPPLMEQKRITEKVEGLLGRVEEAKALIEEAKKTFEVRRATILDKAFRGELSAKWREDNRIAEDASSLLERIQIQKRNSSIKSNTLKITSVIKEEEPFELPNGWTWVRLGEISYYVTSGSRDWSKYYSDEGAMFIRTQDINKNSLNLSDVAYVSLPEKVEGKRSLVEKADILTTITGANVGKCALVETNIKEAYVSQSVALTKLIEKSISKYVHLSLLSPCGGGNELEERAYGIGRPVLSLEDIKNIKIPLAPMAEQQVIVKLVETLLENEKESLNLASIEKHLETLKQSILNKAFRGELGTNDPNEESSMKLLKKVLQEKIK